MTNKANFFIDTINKSFSTQYSILDDPKGIVVDIIKKMSLDEDKLNEIASKSYNHVNGFSKIVLFESKDRLVKIRLHLWQPNYKRGNLSDLHDHRWSYLSIPIIGGVKEKRFSEVEFSKRVGGQKKVRYECFSRGDTEWLNLEGYQIVSLLEKNDTIHEIGKIYFCEAGEIHQIEPLSLPSATIVITFHPIKNSARVYRDKIENEDFMKIYVPNLTVSQIKDHFAFILSRC